MTSGPAENIYQMYVRRGDVGFFVKRNSWTHPRSLARVVEIGGALGGVLPGCAPYFGNPKVIAEILYQARMTRGALSRPGTYAYREVERPDWL